MLVVLLIWQTNIFFKKSDYKKRKKLLDFNYTIYKGEIISKEKLFKDYIYGKNKNKVQEEIDRFNLYLYFLDYEDDKSKNLARKKLYNFFSKKKRNK